MDQRNHRDVCEKKESSTFGSNHIQAFYETDPKVNDWNDGPTSVPTVPLERLRRGSRSLSYSTATASKFPTRRTRRETMSKEIYEQINDATEMSEEEDKKPIKIDGKVITLLTQVHDLRPKYDDVFNESKEGMIYFADAV